MLKVFLCDDIPLQLCILEDLVKQYFLEKELPADIRKFESGEQLLAFVRSEGPADIYMLDMILPGIKGIGIGHELRAMGDTGKIIYITTTSEYAVESYLVDASSYMLKPIGRKVLFGTLDKVLSGMPSPDSKKEAPASEQYFEIRTKSGNAIISLNNLMYIDISGRALCWHLADGSDCIGPMLRVPFAQAVEDVLAFPGFISSGTHLVVNISAVVAADKKSITFKNGAKIFPSKSACAVIYEKIREKI